MNLLRFSFYSLLGAALAVGVSSCEEKDYNSYLPVFSGFRVSPQEVHVGDSMTVVAVQSDRGRLLNSTSYHWTIRNAADSVLCDTTFQVIYDHQPADPAIGYRIPAEARSGRYRITFEAKYNYSGQGFLQPVTPGNPGGGNGSITVTESGALYGKCRGEIQMMVY